MAIYRASGGANRRIMTITRASGGANRTVREIYRAYDGVNRLVFGPMSIKEAGSSPAVGWNGTNTTHDYGTYLYANVSGYMSQNVGVLRATAYWLVQGLAAGDTVRITWSANSGGMYSDAYIKRLNARGGSAVQLTATSSSFNATIYEYIMPIDGRLEIGVNNGSATNYNRWVKITRITVNGKQIYPQ